jgi:hypothetical protein
MSETRRNMVDLETFGTKPGSPIASIGAVRFDGEKILDKFYVVVDVAHSPLQAFDGDTVKWWLGQAKGAQEALLNKESHSLFGALHMFTEWLGDDAGEVWGNGASFDNVLLQAAYEACGMDVPWKFWNDRCFRTVKNLYRDVKAPKRKGTHHNALDDAIHQAEHLIAINEKYYILD